MNTIATTKTSMLALAAAALLSAGFSAANAQEFTRPNVDIRALEAPVDVTPEQLRAQQYRNSPVFQGRSIAIDRAGAQDR